MRTGRAHCPQDGENGAATKYQNGGQDNGNGAKPPSRRRCRSGGDARMPRQISEVNGQHSGQPPLLLASTSRFIGCREDKHATRDELRWRGLQSIAEDSVDNFAGQNGGLWSILPAAPTR